MTAQQEQPSGRDLARVALHNARKAAKSAPAKKQAAKRLKGTARRPSDGRDVITFAEAITRLMDDHAWEAPAAGGSVMDQWPSLAPELAGKVAAVGFDAATGTLHLRPSVPAYGTQLRLRERETVARINEKAGREVIRHLHVLAPGPISVAPSTGNPNTPPPPEPAVPVGEGTYYDVLPGWKAARAAVAAAPKRTLDPAIARAIEAQTAGQAREPESAFTDAVAAREDAATHAAVGYDPERSHQAAIRRARAQRAGHDTAIRTAFGRTA